MSLRGQASTEYLVILGAVLLVSAITVSVMALNSDSSAAQVQESSAYWRSTYPFIITAAKSVGPAIVLTLQNAADEPLWLSGISADGKSMLLYDYSGDVFGAPRCPSGLDSCSIAVEVGQSVTVVARSDSECAGRMFSLDDVQLSYSNLDLSGLLQVGDRSLAGYCSQKVNGVSLSSPSPSNDSWFSAGSNITINTTIQGMALSGLNLTWNESTARIYDDSLVLAYNFDDQSAVGDTAGKVVDVSRYGNNGVIYGNTQLLLHLDENDSYRAYDESKNASNATIYGNTKLLLHMDESSGNNAYDDSVYSINGTCYNMVGSVCNRVSGNSGNGISFDGVDDYVGVPYGTTFNSTSISIWFKGTGYSLISSLYWHGSGHTGYRISIVNSTRFYGQLYHEPGGSTTLFADVPSGVNFSDGTAWHHIMLTFNSGGMSIYLDGALANNTVKSITFFSPEGIPDTDVGRYNFQDNGYFNGSVDEVAIYSKTLNSTEVLDIYNAGSAKFSERTAGKSGSGLQFDGIDDYLVTTSFAIPSTTNAVTYEVWAKSGTSPNVQVLFSDNAQGAGGFIDIYRSGGSSHQMAFQYGNGTYYYAIYFSHVFDSGDNPSFIHVAIVADYAANNVSVYRNGAYSSSASMVSAIFPSANRQKYIGNYRPGHSSAFNGTLDEIGIYSRALTPAEILAHYNAGKARHADWTPDGKAGSAMTFDGVDDYVKLPNSARQTGSQTMALWYKSPYPRVINNYQGLVGGKGQSSSTTCGHAISIQNTSGKLYSDICSGDAYGNHRDLLTYDLPPDGAWHFLASSYDTQSNLHRFYLDSEVKNNTPNFLTYDVNWSTGSFHVGRDGGNAWYFNGSIDEFNYYNRSLSPEEVRQLYYSRLSKYAPDKWLFTATEQFVPAGTYGYSIAAAGLGETYDFTANRTVRVS